MFQAMRYQMQTLQRCAGRKVCKNLQAQKELANLKEKVVPLSALYRHTLLTSRNKQLFD